MRRGLLQRALAVAALASLHCASKDHVPLPTLEDYSDGTSRWVEALLDSWKSGAPAAELFARPLAWSGPLPGDAPTAIDARAPFSIAVYREGSPSPAPASPATAGADLGADL